MPITRRRLLVTALALPGLLMAGRAAGALADAAAGAAQAIRPTPQGTSATRCAQCGSADHGMLDPRCPLAPRVLA